MPLALVTAVSGIGDVIRITPLIRVFHELGYDVDVLLAPDYLETWTLLDGAPEIRELYYVPSPWCRDRDSRDAGLNWTRYDVATFTALGGFLRPRVRADLMLAFDPRQWKREGDTACLDTMARRLGWDGALPPPFVMHSGRDFALPPGTVALHPGCKPGWGWKRWHGFAALAQLLPEVVIVGTRADLADAATAYFHEPAVWPAHARSFVDGLTLADTAALLSRCDAVVANDSGLMHVAAALGVPTIGIFGLTSPARETMPLPWMHVVTKGLSCEPACRLRPWGRSGCEHSLQCMRSLAPAEVLAALEPILAASARTAHV